MGPGLTVSEPVIADTLNFNIHLAGFNYSRHFERDYTQYKGQAKMRFAGALFQYFPFKNAFSLTAGVYYNASRINFHMVHDRWGNYQIYPNVFYTDSQVGYTHGSVTFNKFAPYLGITIGNRIDHTGLSFVFNAGAIYQGSPHVHFTSNGTSPAVQAYVARKRKAWNRDLHGWKFYPVVRIGLHYHF